MQLKVEVDSLERMLGMVIEVAFEMFSFFIFCILRISFSKWYSYTCNVSYMEQPVLCFGSK
jgi:hypothetical protein